MCLGAARRRADGCLQIVADAERRSLVGEGALPCAAVGPVRRGLDAMGLDGWERGFAYIYVCEYIFSMLFMLQWSSKMVG